MFEYIYVYKIVQAGDCYTSPLLSPRAVSGGTWCSPVTQTSCIWSSEPPALKWISNQPQFKVAYAITLHAVYWCRVHLDNVLSAASCFWTIPQTKHCFELSSAQMSLSIQLLHKYVPMIQDLAKQNLEGKGGLKQMSTICISLISQMPRKMEIQR